jgi:hypothetical protein
MDEKLEASLAFVQSVVQDACSRIDMLSPGERDALRVRAAELIREVGRWRATPPEDAQRITIIQAALHLLEDCGKPTPAALHDAPTEPHLQAARDREP